MFDEDFIAPHQVLQKGEIVFREGENLRSLFRIRSGFLKLRRTFGRGQSKALRIAGPGDFLGYESLFDETSPATCEALQECHLQCFSQEAVLARLSEHPHLKFEILKNLWGRLKRQEETHARFLFLNVRERMAYFLLSLGKNYGSSDQGRTQLPISLTFKEIADIVGTTRETANRLLSEFKKDGLIEVRDKHGLVFNEGGLLRLSEPGPWGIV